jgi:gluconolactonase
MPDVKEIASGLGFPEGPVAMRDGSVIVTEISTRRLTRVGADGSKDVVAETGGGPNGAAIGPDGKLYVCNNGGAFDYTEVQGMNFPSQPPSNHEGGRIERVDLDSGEVDVIYSECDGRALIGPNDLVFDRDGGFYFTDHGIRHERTSDRTSVFYAKPDGSEINEVITPLDAPNGVGLSPDGTRLYVAETFTACVWWWEVSGPGKVEPAAGLFPHGGTLLTRLPGFQFLDSLGVDGDGNVCLATLGSGGITSVSPEDGSVVDFIETGDILTTNVCFGGDGLRTGYVTLSGSGRLAEIAWPRAGLELAHNA